MTITWSAKYPGIAWIDNSDHPPLSEPIRPRSFGFSVDYGARVSPRPLQGLDLIHLLIAGAPLR